MPYEEFLTFADRPEAWEQLVHDYSRVCDDVHVHSDGGSGPEGDMANPVDADVPEDHQAILTDVNPGADSTAHSDIDPGASEDHFPQDWT
jgi:hypothetical protein